MKLRASRVPPAAPALVFALFALLELTEPVCGATADAFTSEQIEFFENKVRPVLATHWNHHPAQARHARGDGLSGSRR